MERTLGLNYAQFCDGHHIALAQGNIRSEHPMGAQKQPTDIISGVVS
jgi:hypothetical protein